MDVLLISIHDLSRDILQHQWRWFKVVIGVSNCPGCQELVDFYSFEHGSCRLNRYTLADLQVSLQPTDRHVRVVPRRRRRCRCAVWPFVVTATIWWPKPQRRCGGADSSLGVIGADRRPERPGSSINGEGEDGARCIMIYMFHVLLDGLDSELMFLIEKPTER